VDPRLEKEELDDGGENARQERGSLKRLDALVVQHQMNGVERPFGPSGKRTRRRARDRGVTSLPKVNSYSMRQLVLDTETTGLNARTGDRIIEIGCVELVNRRLTGNNLHFYVNPGRDSDPGRAGGARPDHGILSDKPKFADIAAELRDFVAARS